jgi:hypothetical protein
MTVIAETERVILRELQESDAESVLAFNGDPRIMPCSATASRTCR